MTTSRAPRRRSMASCAAIVLAVGAVTTAGPALAASVNGLSLVSRDTAGGFADSSSSGPAVSGNGAYVCFDSSAADIVVGDAVNTQDVFRYNTTTETTTLASRTPGGKPAGRSSQCHISDNGRYIVYESTSPAVAPGLTGRAPRLVLYDAVAHTATIISKTLDGTPKTARTFGVDFSGDGRYVVYADLQLSLGGGYHDYDIYRYDRVTDTTASLVHEGEAGRVILSRPAVSEDGRYVAYLRTPPKGKQPVGSASLYLLDSLTGTTTLVSATPKGTINGAAAPDLSDNGRFLTYYSNVAGLAPGDTTTMEDDVFLYDATTGVTTLVSRSAAGQAGNDRSLSPSISGSGRYIAFQSNASDLVTGDEDPWSDIFRYDRVTGTTQLVSLSYTGESTPDSTVLPSIGGVGDKIAFLSDGVDFVEGDDSVYMDVYLWTLPQ